LIPTEPSGTVVVVDVVVVVVVVGGTVVLVVVVVVVVVAAVVVVVVVGGTVVLVVVVGAAVVVVVLSMVTLLESALLSGPAFPALSATPLAASRSTTVPSLVHVTDTVTELPEDADGENVHPEAVPPKLLKSPDAMPETLSENARV
jgi:hypothetical protein